mgnify:FL=1
MPMMFSPSGESLDIPDIAIHAMVALGWEVHGDSGRHAAPEDTSYGEDPESADEEAAPEESEDIADQESEKPARRSRTKAKTEE